MAVKNEVKTVTDRPNPRPHRRRADQTMDVLAANIPLLLLADLAGEGTQPITEGTADPQNEQTADSTPPEQQREEDFDLDGGLAEV